jgi:predicted adenine nucleotide alpha hydrolase (AANH) superfamily ATPase
MGKMYDRLSVQVRVDCSRREIVSESEIRIANETQLYEQLIGGCIF